MPVPPPLDQLLISLADDHNDALTRLIRQAAITAIHDGTEKITKNTLETITLDHHTEQQRRPTR